MGKKPQRPASSAAATGSGTAQNVGKAALSGVSDLGLPPPPGAENAVLDFIKSFLALDPTAGPEGAAQTNDPEATQFNEVVAQLEKIWTEAFSGAAEFEPDGTDEGMQRLSDAVLQFIGMEDKTPLSLQETIGSVLASLQSPDAPQLSERNVQVGAEISAKVIEALAQTRDLLEGFAPVKRTIDGIRDTIREASHAIDKATQPENTDGTETSPDKAASSADPKAPGQSSSSAQPLSTQPQGGQDGDMVIRPDPLPSSHGVLAAGARDPADPNQGNVPPGRPAGHARTQDPAVAGQIAEIRAPVDAESTAVRWGKNFGHDLVRYYGSAMFAITAREVLTFYAVARPLSKTSDTTQLAVSTFLTSIPLLYGLTSTLQHYLTNRPGPDGARQRDAEGNEITPSWYWKTKTGIGMGMSAMALTMGMTLATGQMKDLGAYAFKAAITGPPRSIVQNLFFGMKKNVASLYRANWKSDIADDIAYTSFQMIGAAVLSSAIAGQLASGASMDPVDLARSFPEILQDAFKLAAVLSIAELGEGISYDTLKIKFGDYKGPKELADLGVKHLVQRIALFDGVDFSLESFLKVFQRAGDIIKDFPNTLPAESRTDWTPRSQFIHGENGLEFSWDTGKFTVRLRTEPSPGIFSPAENTLFNVGINTLIAAGLYHQWVWQAAGPEPKPRDHGIVETGAGGTHGGLTLYFPERTGSSAGSSVLEPDPAAATTGTALTTVAAPTTDENPQIGATGGSGSPQIGDPATSSGSPASSAQRRTLTAATAEDYQEILGRLEAARRQRSDSAAKDLESGAGGTPRSGSLAGSRRSSLDLPGGALMSPSELSLSGTEPRHTALQTEGPTRQTVGGSRLPRHDSIREVRESGAAGPSAATAAEIADCVRRAREMAGSQDFFRPDGLLADLREQFGENIPAPIWRAILTRFQTHILRRADEQDTRMRVITSIVEAMDREESAGVLNSLLPQVTQIIRQFAPPQWVQRWSPAAAYLFETIIGMINRHQPMNGPSRNQYQLIDEVALGIRSIRQMNQLMAGRIDRSLATVLELVRTNIENVTEHGADALVTIMETALALPSDFNRELREDGRNISMFSVFANVLTATSMFVRASVAQRELALINRVAGGVRNLPEMNSAIAGQISRILQTVLFMMRSTVTSMDQNGATTLAAVLRSVAALPADYNRLVPEAVQVGTMFTNFADLLNQLPREHRGTVIEQEAAVLAGIARQPRDSSTLTVNTQWSLARGLYTNLPLVPDATRQDAVAQNIQTTLQAIRAGYGPEPAEDAPPAQREGWQRVTNLVDSFLERLRLTRADIADASPASQPDSPSAAAASGEEARRTAAGGQQTVFTGRRPAAPVIFQPGAPSATQRAESRATRPGAGELGPRRTIIPGLGVPGRHDPEYFDADRLVARARAQLQQAGTLTAAERRAAGMRTASGSEEGQARPPVQMPAGAPSVRARIAALQAASRGGTAPVILQQAPRPAPTVAQTVPPARQPQPTGATASQAVGTDPSQDTEDLYGVSGGEEEDAGVESSDEEPATQTAATQMTATTSRPEATADEESSDEEIATQVAPPTQRTATTSRPEASADEEDSDEETATQAAPPIQRTATTSRPEASSDEEGSDEEPPTQAAPTAPDLPRG